MTALIFKKIIDVMREIEPIAKAEKNKQQGFMYRGIDTIYNSLQPIMAKNGLFTVATIDHVEKEITQSKSTGADLHYSTVTINYTIYAEDGSNISGKIAGQAMDTGDKSIGKAMSYAHRYFLTQLFMIPTGDEDADATSYETVSKSYQPPPQKKQYYAPSGRKITENQLNYLNKVLSRKGVNTTDFVITHGYSDASEITMDKFNDILEKAKNYQAEEPQDINF